MTITHGWISQLANKRQEDEPLFDFFENSGVRIAALVNFHFFECFEQFLDLFLHFVGVSLEPLQVHVTLEDSLALVDVVPQNLHAAHFSFHGRNLTFNVVDEGSLLEFLSLEEQFGALIVVILDFVLDARQRLKSLFSARVVLVEVSFFHVLNV